MRAITSTRRLLGLGVIELVLIGILGGLLHASPALAAQPQDAWITTKVKIELLTADEIDPFAIDVDTLDGGVTLHGTVGSEALRERAEDLASGIDGVTEVRNLLAVVPAAAAARVEASDSELRSRIEAGLAGDPALEKSAIRVKSVHDGIVVLTGDAETLSAHRHALERVRGMEGVERAASEIRSPDELADREIWSDAEPTAGGMTATLRSAASDTWTTTRAKVALMAEPGLSPLAVSVDTRDGVVTLFGTVPSEQAKETAGSRVMQISGVKGIENELQVVPDVAAGRVEQQDDQITLEIGKRLAERPALADADLEVEVNNAVVRLTGTANSYGDKMTALTVARGTEGVDSVVDGIEVAKREE